MNKLKKSLALIATLAIASTAFVACGDDSSSTGDSSSKTDSSSKADDSSSKADNSSSQVEGSEIKFGDDGDVLSVLCWTADDIGKMIEFWDTNNAEQAGKVKYVNVGSKGQEAREGYVNYFNGDEDVDLFVVEADWILEYINNDTFSAPMSDLGFADSAFDDQYAYTKAVATDSNGVIKASSWQATPGAYVYNVDLAKEHLGVNTPEEMQEKVKDWDTFTATAKELAPKGIAMADTLGGMWQVWQYNRSQAWLDADNKLQVDEFCTEYANLAKEYYDNGYVTKEAQWTDGWATIGTQGKTMGYFFCTWCLGANAQLEKSKGDYTWNITAGPSSYAWGGSWLAVSPECDNGQLAHDFVEMFTVNPETMKEYALFKGEFVNNPTVMKEIVDEGSNKNDLLGGQDQFAVLYEAASKIDMDGKITAYDAQIKDAFNNSVDKLVKGEFADVDTMINEFKKECAKIEGISVE